MDFGFKLYFKDKTVYTSQSSLAKNVKGDTVEYSANIDGIDIKWCFTDHKKGTIVTLSMDSDKALNIVRVDSLIFKVQGIHKTDRVAFFGKATRTRKTYPCDLGENREYSGDSVGLYRDFTAPGVSISFISPFTNSIGAGVVRTGNDLEFFAKTEYTEGMLDEHHLECERLFYSDDITIDELYDIYRDLLPQSSFPMPKLVGWNTWDYYLARVTPEDIFENIDAMKNMSFADKLDYIVIDDGWQKEWGDWVENDKFACGLEYVAKRIIDAGFMPGIWAAPLLMKLSYIEDGRQHWKCKYESSVGMHFSSDLGLLDPTVPEVEEFILEFYRRLYSYGYRLFKIDYLSPLTLIKTFYNKDETGYSALRNLINRIKEATGPDAVILGCSLPIQCGADIAPSMRISYDIHNHFGHVKVIADALTWSWMYNNKVTRIDPDFLVIRGEETADEPLIWEPSPKYLLPKRMCDMKDSEFLGAFWRNGDQFNAIEAETWANLVAISGGNIFLSDRMSVLNQKGLDIIAKAMDRARDFCRPKFLKTDTCLPALWLADDEFMLINWDDIPTTITVDLTDLPEGAAALTSDKEFSIADGKLSVALLPHECFVGNIN